MPRDLRQLLLAAILLGATGCAHGLAVEAASKEWSCPEKQIVATEREDDTWWVTGCGKQSVFVCESVPENENTPQQSWKYLCRPSDQAAREDRRRAQLQNDCADQCNEVAATCERTNGCDANSSCDHDCATMAAQCQAGCVSGSQPQP